MKKSSQLVLELAPESAPDVSIGRTVQVNEMLLNLERLEFGDDILLGKLFTDVCYGLSRALLDDHSTQRIIIRDLKNDLSRGTMIKEKIAYVRLNKKWRYAHKLDHYVAYSGAINVIKGGNDNIVLKADYLIPVANAITKTSQSYEQVKFYLEIIRRVSSVILNKFQNLGRQEASKYSGPRMDRRQMVSIAEQAMLHALYRYCPYYGYAFGPHAKLWIKHFCLAEVKRTIQRQNDDIECDTIGSMENAMVLAGEDNTWNPEQLESKSKMSELLHSALKNPKIIDTRRADIIFRYEMLGNTLEEIANDYGVSIARIGVLRKQGLDKLKAALFENETYQDVAG